MKAIEMIEVQQKGREGTAPWMVGEQLKDICRREPNSAELIAQDLAVAEMSLVEAEKKIRAYADSHKKGNFSCVTPDVADSILRKFYGLSKPENVVVTPAAPAAKSASKIVDLSDFLG